MILFFYIPLLLTPVLYLMYLLHASYADFLRLIVSLLTLSVSVMINDVYDSRFEKNVRKPDIYVMLALLGFGAVYNFLIGIKYFALYLIFLGISFIYSAPAIRLKNRHVLGVLSVVLIETIIPLLMVFNYFRVFTESCLYFLAFYLFLNFSGITERQINNYSKDLKSKINTFAVSFGLEKSKKLLTLSKILTLVFSIPLLFYLLIIPEMDYFLILCTIGFFIYKKNFYTYFTRLIYSGLIPLFISFLLVLQSINNAVVFVIVLLLEKNFIINSFKIVNSFLFDSGIAEIEPPY